MKVIILAGGFGTRLSEETVDKPKPMVEIGGYPILWHIMKTFSHFEFREFVIALGYKSHVIKRYFLEYAHLCGNITLRIKDGRVESTHRDKEDWTIHLEDTGIETLTGGRVKKLEKLVADERFIVTYGDGVADVDLNALVEFHQSSGKLATLTAVRPPARFGGLALDEKGLVKEFVEKPQTGEGWINGGFIVFEPEVLKMITAEEYSLEYGLLRKLAEKNELAAYRHDGFWQCMDTLRDLKYLEKVWNEGNAPWKKWN